MGGLPEGTVTFLLTDVEGSTRLWVTDPHVAAHRVRRTYEVIGACVERHGGVRPVEQGEGDSTVSVFPRAGDALAAALDAQVELADLAGSAEGRIAVRMALHTGEAMLRDEGNYMGPTVIRCARLRDLGNGGDVLVSNATAGLVADALPAGARLLDEGEHVLRDLVRPERVWRLSHPSLRSGRPLRVAVGGRRTNLRRPSSDLVGRERELDELAGLVAPGRLVTLTGSGGVGKTRLALELAVRAAEELPGGSWWVDLAPVVDPLRVPSAAAAAMGIAEEAGVPTLETVAGWLAPRSAMVVLDNCEHLIDAVAGLTAALTERGPQLRVVATSREPLGLAGEITWHTPSLSCPPRSASTATAIGSFDAVELFVRRAAAAHPGFVVTDDTAGPVTEICRRLDGIPLALELAGARVRSLSPQLLAASLDDRFRTLTGGARTALPRQRTLNASVQWSYDLLEPDAQRLFRRLSVFAGPFTAEAATTTCSDDDLPEAEVLAVLTSLVERSLVEHLDDGRYRLLETLRHYAQEQALAAGEAATWRDRHLRWCQSIAGRHRPGPAMDARRFRQAAELLPDLVQALSWSMASPVPALDLVPTISQLQLYLARHDDSRRLAHSLHDALEGTPVWTTAMANLLGAPLLAGDLTTLQRQGATLARATGPLDRARLLLATGVVASMEGRPEGEHALREAATLAAAAGADDDEAGALLGLATDFVTVGRLREARPIVAELAARCRVDDGPFADHAAMLGGLTAADASIPTAVRLIRRTAAEIGDASGLRAISDSWLLACAWWSQDIDLAHELSGAGRLNDSGSWSDAFGGLARALPLIFTGDLDDAARALRPSLEVWTFGVGSVWLRLIDTDLALRQGDRSRAESTLAEVAAALEATNAPLHQSHLGVLRTGLALTDGKVRTALQHAHDALDLGTVNDNALLIVDGLEAVAISHHRLAHPELAARLLGATATYRARSGYRWRHAPVDGHADEVLGDPELQSAVDAGRALTLAEAVTQTNRGRVRRGRPATG